MSFKLKKHRSECAHYSTKITQHERHEHRAVTVNVSATPKHVYKKKKKPFG